MTSASALPAGRATDGGVPRRVAAVCGVAATCAGLGVAQLVALVTGPSSAPLLAVSDAFVDRVPAWLKEAAIGLFGTADKIALLVGAALVVLIFGAGVGVLASRRPGWGAWSVVALAGVSGLAAVTRPDADRFAMAPSLVAGLAAIVVLRFLLGRARTASPGQGAYADGATSRRAVLAVPAVVLAGGAAAWATGWLLTAKVRGGEASRRLLRLPVPASPAPALPADVEVGVQGVAPFRVPNADFYRIDTALVVPQVAAEQWRLRIHGLVQKEVTLDYDDLVSGALVERDVTLTCVSNEVGGDLIGNAVWLGLPIGPLLEQAGPLPAADMVLSRSADGWTASTPLEALIDGRDALLAIGMNGQPLPLEHGFPVRMVVPGLYGYVSATKWVTDLEVTRFDRDEAYWTPRGWSARGPVKTSSRIDVPQDGGQVQAGTVAVAGVAWAQHRGIRAVEVRVDGGAWQACRLAGVPSVDTWRQWVFRWEATPGDHEIQVRATDGDGVVQTGAQAEPAPDGATGWHTIRVGVR